MTSTSSPSVFTRVMNGITKMRVITFNLIFLALLTLILVAAISSCSETDVVHEGALLIDPDGIIADTADPGDPFANLLGNSPFKRYSLQSILKSIETAASDSDITGIVLRLDKLASISSAHAARIGQALATFRESGKTVQSYGYTYSQTQYLLASHADAVYLHPDGSLLLPGYGVFQQYYRGLLDKLQIDTHVFKVGTYKSLAEPYLRDDMSQPSKEANQALVDSLWQQFADRIALNRSIEVGQVDAYSRAFPEKLSATNGEMSRVALENHLVDELLTADQARARFRELFGATSDGNNFKQVDFRRYGANALANLPSGRRVAVINAEGPILMSGQVAEAIVPDKIIPLIRQARHDDAVGAVVLRVNSPGGSAMASELIRQELELLQLASKPVVASMSSVAASGGYWISATADRIVAEPSTITGSIGIIGILPTFDKALGEVGVQTDGVGTSPLSNATNLLLPLNPQFAEVMQLNIEHGYQQFLNLVARGRDLTPEQVDQVAQGRVWTGEAALAHKLVDQLGGLELAVEQAALLAGMSEYSVDTLREPESLRDALLRELLPAATSLTSAPAHPLVAQFLTLAETLQRLDDPQQRYAVCLVCESVVSGL